ncbi:MAG: tRNA preQ1(34) S-adenosylmethionine ribosyltransferase-isomerase QueA [Vicinamibacterales bacterium]
MLVSEFDFDLPADLVAQEPAPRGTSRLLVLHRRTGEIEHASVADLPRFLGAGDLMVVNNTRVFAARLLGHRVPSGGAVECLLVRRTADRDVWEALMHPGQKLKVGGLVRFEGAAGALTGEILGRQSFGRRTIRLHADSGGDVVALIDLLGHMPLPPYIKRPDAAMDRERYQTVFASVRGSIAAPTAGLHFTPDLLDALAARGVGKAAVTLHVGYGTFKPVRTEEVESHVVDPEHYEIDDEAAAAINRAKDERRRVLVVGTTTTRALEDSASRHAARLLSGEAEATTFIYPGFEFQVADALMTNFHLPKSSLLMLVAAFAGREQVLTAYRAAIAQRYRFYSYGDAMLIL